MIINIEFDEIFAVWNYFLWPARQSKIETNSAMCHLGGYNMYNMSTKPSFFAYIIKDAIVGVNSGHMCANDQYRSRGLYVFPDYRNKGIGTELLLKTIEQGVSEGANMIWSYPKQSSWRTYEKAGFVLSGDWEKSELGFNAYCNLIVGAGGENRTRK